MTSPGAAAARSAILLVPLGSTEQHGPHLPLDTDTLVAVAVATGAAARHDGVFVAPALPYGASGEHQSFPGTVSIGQAALELVVLELGRSASEHVRRIVFVNGHGGNVEALQRAIATLRDEGRDVAMWSPRLAGGDTHAGRTETSLLLAIAPDLVRIELAEPGNTDALEALMPSLRIGGVAAVSPNGVLGDPTGATAEEGNMVLAQLIDDLDRLLNATEAPDQAT